MGFIDKAAERVRAWIRKDKESSALDFAKGATNSGYPTQGYDLLQAYGYDVVSDFLRLENDLMSRYVDFEEMDQYPEITCLHGDSRVFTLEYGWVKISDLAARSEEFYVLAYDKRVKSLVPARACNARRTGKSGHNKKMVRVLFDNGQDIVCTADHLFLTKENKWVEADSLLEGNRLMPGVLRIRALNGELDRLGGRGYWQVHQPNFDSEIRSSDGKRWTWIHRLAGKWMRCSTARAAL